jgi:hypothetical protein
MVREKTKSKILSIEEMKTLRKERSRTLDIELPSLEAPKPFPTLAEVLTVVPTPGPVPPPFRKELLGSSREANLAPVVPLPLARPGSTDQRQLPTGPHYSGLIRRRPRKAA